MKSVSDKYISVRNRILDFAASMSIVNRLAWSMIIRRNSRAKRKAMGRRQASSSKSKTVAVVVPMYKEELSAEEQISLRHLLHFLRRYDKYVICPRSLKIKCPHFKIRRFNDKFFAGVSSYSKLMLSKDFYETFAEYNYILIYQLDSLVFSDRLEEWCAKSLDYVGAPWFKHYSDDPREGFWAVGNGGFSLRRIESFLKVLNSERYYVDPDIYWKVNFASKPKYIRYLNLPRRIFKRVKSLNDVKWVISRFDENEDHFWAFEAKVFYPEFRVASVYEGLRFSFECAPRFCFEQNNHQPPFGCHAWYKYDRKFWEPYLLK